MAQEGAIVRNKTTGQMGRIVNGRVVPLSGGGNTAPINTGVNPADVDRRNAQALREREFQYRQSRDAAEDARENEKMLAQQDAIKNSVSSIDRTIKILKDIRADAADNSGWGETGTSGNFMRSIPLVGNAGKDLERKVKSVKGLNAFTALKDLAAQGVKLTPISNAEIDLAASSVANIDPELTQDEFLAAVDQAIAFHSDARNKLSPGGKSGANSDDDLIKKYLD